MSRMPTHQLPLSWENPTERWQVYSSWILWERNNKCTKISQWKIDGYSLLTKAESHPQRILQGGLGDIRLLLLLQKKVKKGLLKSILKYFMSLDTLWFRHCYRLWSWCSQEIPATSRQNSGYSAADLLSRVRMLDVVRTAINATTISVST